MTELVQVDKRGIVSRVIGGVFRKYNAVAEDLEREAAKDKLNEMGYAFGMWSVLDREGKILMKRGKIHSYRDIETWEEGVKLKGSMTVVNFDGEERTIDLEFDYTKEIR